MSEEGKRKLIFSAPAIKSEFRDAINKEIALPRHPEAKQNYLESARDTFQREGDSMVIGPRFPYSTASYYEGPMKKSASYQYRDAVMARPRYYDPIRSYTLLGIPFQIQLEQERAKIRQWCRFYMMTHHLVPTAIEIFARFPLIGFENTCKDSGIKEFYDELFLDENRLNYKNFLVQLGLEYWTVGECLEADSKIKMADGTVKNIENIQIGDKVITHKGNKEIVTERFRRNSIKEIYKIKVEGFYKSIRATGNHPILAAKNSEIMCEVRPEKQPCYPDVKCSSLQSYYRQDGMKGKCSEKNGCKKEWDFRWIPARKLEKGDYVFSPIDNEINISFSKSISPEWARLLGYFVSEGCFLKSRGKSTRGNIIGVIISNTEKEIIDEIVRLAKKISNSETKIRIKEHSNTKNDEKLKQCYSVYIQDKDLAKQFYFHGGEYCKTKILSQEFMTASPDLQIEFLEAYINGDGWVEKNKGGGRINLSTSSESLAYQLLTLCYRNQIGATILERKMKQSEKSIVLNKDQNSLIYIIRISFSDADKIRKLSSNNLSKIQIPSHKIKRRRFIDGGIIQKVAFVEKLPFNDYVYNLEVENDHSYVADNVAVHNCFPFGDWNDDLGVWVSEQLMDPDLIDVTYFTFLKSRAFKMKIPDHLKKLISEKKPKEDYEALRQLYPEIIPFIARNEPIPIDASLMNQIRCGGTEWETHGIPILMRAFRQLMLEEKLNMSQMAVAERLYLPLLVGKLGAANFGEGQFWIPTETQLASLRDDVELAMSSDFRFIATHFAVEFQSVFGREVVPDMTSDYDQIERRLLNVFGISQSIISGESQQAYASTAINADFLNQRLKSYQDELKVHCKNRYRAVAAAQGFYDYETKGGRLIPIFEEHLIIDPETGEKRKELKRKLLYPEPIMRVMDLRDEATQREFLFALRDAGIPIADSSMMIGVEWEFADELDKKLEEDNEKIIKQQIAHKQLFNKLKEEGLPIPVWLREEMAGIPSGEEAQGQVGPSGPPALKPIPGGAGGEGPELGGIEPIGEIGSPETEEEESVIRPLPQNRMRPEESSEEMKNMPRPPASLGFKLKKLSGEG